MAASALDRDPAGIALPERPIFADRLLEQTVRRAFRRYRQLSAR